MTKDLKRRHFETGSAAIARISTYRGLYACPTCMRLLPIEALDNAQLTLEHVPQASQGGKGIALTCNDCNSTAGHTVDAALFNRERFFGLASGLSGRRGEFKDSVKIQIGETTVNAIMTMKDGEFIFEVNESLNNPKRFAEQLAWLNSQPAGAEISMQTQARVKFGWHPARVGDLRSAYLAAFATFGYRYAFHPRLDGVRRQIHESTAELIDGAWWIAGPELAEDPMLMVMTDPFQGVLVRIGKVLLAVPWLTGPADFYTEVRGLFGRHAGFSGDHLEWPTKLHLLGDR